MSGQHTPLHVERDGEECYVTASDALERLCTMSRPTARQRLEDAKMIVRACNSHQELLEALKAVSRLDYLQEHNALAIQVKSAIAKAQGSTQ